MSSVVAYKEPSWMEDTTDLRLWKTVTRAYDLDLFLLEPDDNLSFRDGSVIVIVDQQGETDLESFVHPPDCAYVFGRTHMNNLMDTPHDDSIVINYPGDVSLFGFQAAVAVLADRRRKL